MKTCEIIWIEPNKNNLLGISTLSPPKIVITSIIFMQLILLVIYGHHILDFFAFLKYIWLTLNLIFFFFLKCNKKWKTWMYGIYLWQNNTHYKVWKNCIYTSKLRFWVAFLGEFFMVYDIDTLIKSMTN